MKKIEALVLTFVVIMLSFVMVDEVKAVEPAKETWIGDDLVEMCEELGMEHHVSPELLEAVIESESSGVPTVRNGNCIGLMQVSSKWHATRMAKLGVKDLTDPRGNILTGVDYLLELFEQYEDPYEVLRIYGGWKVGDPKGEAYIEKILRRAWQLEVIHGKTGAEG